MFNSLSASSKLYLLMFITGSGLIGLGVYAVVDLKKMNDNTQTLYADRVLCIQQLSTMRFEYDAEILPMAQYVKNAEVTFSEAKKRILKAEGIIDTNWRNYKLTYLTPEEKLLVKQTERVKNQAYEAAGNLISVLDKEDAPSLGSFIQKETIAGPAPFALKLNQLINLQVQVAKEILNNNKALYRITSTNFILFIFVSLVIALSLTFYIIKNVKNLIKDILKNGDTIKESENRYHSILENASDAIYLVDNEGCFIEANDSMCKMTGYTKEELLQLKVKDIYDNEQLKTDPADLSLIPYQSIFKLRRFIKKDGATVEVEINGKRLDKDKLIGVARDITERKRMEAKIRDAELKFRTAFEYSAIGIALVSLNGKWLTVNISLCEMLGYQEQDLLGMSFMDITHPDDINPDFNPIHDALASANGISRIEKRYIRRDKSVIWASVNIAAIRDEKGAPLYFVSQILDITERKKAEESQKLIIENEERLRALFDNVEGSTCLIDTNFRLIVFNKVFEKTCTILAGKEPKFGDEIYGFLPLDEQKRRYAILNRVLAGNKEAIEVEYERNGEHLYFRTAFAPIMVDGKVTAISTYSIDFTERKRAELLILKEMQLSETIINSLPGVFYLQSVTGEYLLWNKNFETVTGYTKEEIVKLRTEDLIVEEDLEGVIDTIKKLFVDGYATVEATAKMKDGSRIPFLLTGSPIMYQNQQCLLGTGIDISSRIKAENALRSSEQKYKLLFDNNPVPLWMIARDDLSIIAVNETAANLHGYTTDELLHASITIIRLKEEVEEQRQRFWTDVNGPTDRGIIKHVKKDGTVIFVHLIVNDIVFEGRKVRLSLTNDVTEKLKADELLKKSEANLTTILNNTDTAYALLNADLDILEYNNKALIFAKNEFSFEPNSGGKIFDLMPDDRRFKFLGYIGDVFKGNTISYEVSYQQADGSHFWYYVRMFPIADKDNNILGLVLAITDITERKNTEQSLQTAYEQIKTNIKFIREMIWKQSHILRSPVANLKGLITILGMDPSDKEIMGYIESELERMDTIFMEMATASSKEKMNY